MKVKLKCSLNSLDTVKVSVIVSTYTKDRRSDVLRCLNSLFNQTRKPDEVILVLDNSLVSEKWNVF